MDKGLIASLLVQEEGQTFECKRALKKPSEVLETLCAFANTDGGLFVYGIADEKHFTGEKRLIGINEAPDHSDELLKIISRNFVPPLPAIKHGYVDIVNATGQPDRLLIVKIGSSTTVHSLSTGHTYIRRGRQNNILTHEQSLRLQYEKGSITFETEPARGVKVNHLNQKLAEEFMANNKSQEKGLLKFFLKNGLADEDKGNILLNNAAVLLFTENPSIALKRKCGITISHYFGTEPSRSAKPNFRRPPFTIEGPLLSQIENAFKYVAENALPLKLEGATFKRIKIPEFVLQEAITNAVIHRDYSIQNHIQIRIFDDRIEVESPGWFSGFVSPETILEDRFARNPIIERTLRKMPNPPNLDIGEGVDRMFKEMHKKNLYSPLYLPRRFTPHAVCVMLFNEEKTTYWDSVEKYLLEHPAITNREFCGMVGIDTLKASELFKKWTKQQLLEKVGTSKRNRAYRKPTEKKPNQTDLLGNLF